MPLYQSITCAWTIVFSSTCKLDCVFLDNIYPIILKMMFFSFLFQILDVRSEILPTVIASDRHNKFSRQMHIFNFTFGVVKLSSLVLVLGVSHSPCSLSVFGLALKIILDALISKDMRWCEHNRSLSHAG